MELCKLHTPQTVVYPQAPNNILKFDKYFKREKVPFVLYMDFESFLMPTSDGKIKHVPSGFCALRASKYPKHNGEPHVYSDPITEPGHVVKKMFEYLKEQEEYINSALKPNKPMKLTKDDWRNFHKATHCYGCKRSLKKTN